MWKQGLSVLENGNNSSVRSTGQRTCDKNSISDDSTTDADDNQSVEWVESVGLDEETNGSGTNDKASDKNEVVTNMEQCDGSIETTELSDDNKRPETTNKRCWHKGVETTPRHSRRITLEEGWNVIKVCLDILKTECVPVVLEIVRSCTWEKTLNGVNLFERIQAEQNAVADRTGSSLKTYLRNKLRTNPDFLQIFESELRGCEASHVEKLHELLSEFRHPKKVTPLETQQSSSSNARTRVVRFCHTEERNMVFGICCLLEQNTVEDVRKCLRSQWNLDIEENVNLAEFIGAMDGSIEDRTVTSLKNHWKYIIKDRNRFFKMFRELINEFSSDVQEKFNQLVNIKQSKLD